MQVPTGTHTMREATANYVDATLGQANIERRYDVPPGGVPYATIDPNVIHVTDLPPFATRADCVVQTYIELHEGGHLMRPFDYAVFSDEYASLKPPYRLDNLFIDGPVDHLYYGQYKGADGWRDEGRLAYQSQFIPEEIAPIDPDNRKALVVTAAAMIDCLVRQRTYPKSSRYLAVAFNKQAQGTIVPKLVKLAKGAGFVERFRELYLDAEADNTFDILTAIDELLKLWEPHLPSSQGNPESDNPDGPGEDGEQDGESGEGDGQGDGDGGEQADDQGAGEGEGQEGDGDGGGNQGCDGSGDESGEDGGSHGNSESLAEALLDEHEVKAEQLADQFSTDFAQSHKTGFSPRKPTDPSKTGYNPARSQSRWQYFLGRDMFISADGRVRPEDLSDLVFQNANYLKTGTCPFERWRIEQQEHVNAIAQQDAGLRKLQMYLNAKYQSGKQYGQRSGKLNRRMAHRIVTDVPDDRWRERVFTKAKPKPDPRGTAICLGIDMSGSMSYSVCPNGANRHHIAAGSIVKLSRALDMMKMDYEVFGYTLYDINSMTNRNNVVNVIHKEFGERVPTGTLSARLAQFSPMGANADGESLSMAGERLLSMPHQRKVMIVLSDGEPRKAGSHTGDYRDNPDDYDGDPECGYLKAVVETLTNEGIDMIGLGIDTDTVMNYYPHARNIQAENLGEQLLDVLKELI